MPFLSLLRSSVSCPWGVRCLALPLDHHLWEGSEEDMPGFLKFFQQAGRTEIRKSIDLWHPYALLPLIFFHLSPFLYIYLFLYFIFHSIMTTWYLIGYWWFLCNLLAKCTEYYYPLNFKVCIEPCIFLLKDWIDYSNFPQRGFTLTIVFVPCKC